RSPRHPVKEVCFSSAKSGAIDFGKRLSIVTKDACNPFFTLDQSDNVSAVGSGNSLKSTNSEGVLRVSSGLFSAQEETMINKIVLYTIVFNVLILKFIIYKLI